MMSRERLVKEGIGLISVFADTFRAADEEVEEGAEAVEEDDDDEPDDFVVPFGGFLGDDFNEHPNPEGESEDD